MPARFEYRRLSHNGAIYCTKLLVEEVDGGGRPKGIAPCIKSFLLKPEEENLTIDELKKIYPLDESNG